MISFRDSFFASLTDEEKKDSRFGTSPQMSDSDRQLYFADYVIELQTAEDDKRRRIRDARRRAEKAQRDAYRDLLRKLATKGKILPHSRWRSVEEIVSADESFKLVQAQDRDSPHGLFEEFVEEWEDTYRRDRSFLSRLLQPPDKKEITVHASMSYDDFTKFLLDESAYSPEVYGDARRIISRDEPVSSARLYYDELIYRASDKNNAKRQAARRRATEDSSEDEGEIIEDGEVEDGVGKGGTSQPDDEGQTKTQPKVGDNGEKGEKAISGSKEGDDVSNKSQPNPNEKADESVQENAADKAGAEKS